MAEAISDLIGRPQWRVEGLRAYYEPVEGGWSAIVTAAIPPGRAYVSYHVAIVSPRGLAAHTLWRSTPMDAARAAEAYVGGQNMP